MGFNDETPTIISTNEPHMVVIWLAIALLQIKRYIFKSIIKK